MALTLLPKEGAPMGLLRWGQLAGSSEGKVFNLVLSLGVMELGG